MHEFSLAQNLVTQLLELADQHQATKIFVVSVNIGELSGIVTDSFTFGFEILAKEQPILVGAKLEITPTEGGDLILSRVEME